MAHQRTELTLGPGVTALTGPNNTGKSAVVEALRCVATNPMPRNFIRHGAKEARVTVELEDGVRVVWIRKKGSSGYELWRPGAEEPVEFWKFGRRPPEEILDALRLDIVDLEGNKEIDVHIGNQRDPVFLLNRPDSDAAAFFAASTESAHLLAMQNLLKRKTQDGKRTERELEGRLQEIEAELDGISPLPDIAVDLETARELESTANRLQATIPALETHLSRLAETGAALDRRTRSATVYKGLDAPPKTYEIKPLAALIERMARIEAALEHARKTGGVLTAIAAPPAPFDTVRLATLCNRLQHLEMALDKGRAGLAVLEDLRAVQEPEDVGQLLKLMDELQQVGARLDRAARSGEQLQSIAEPPDVRPDRRLESLVADIRELTQARQEARTWCDELENRLRSVKDGIRRTVDALGQCPTCGADLNSEAFLDQEGGHDA